jgi:hypothetical protein
MAQGDSVKHNYAMSRYLWSLRAHPAASQLEAVWVIYGPKFPLSQAMVSAPRTRTLSDILQSLVGGVTAAPPRTPAETVALKSTKILRGCACQPDGSALLLGPSQLAGISRLEGRGNGISTSLQQTIPLLVPVATLAGGAAVPATPPNTVPTYFL